VIAMSLQSALRDLREATAGFDQAVTELVMIVHEDRPAKSEIAIVDHLAETVSELQADAVLASQRAEAIEDHRHLAGRLWTVDEAIGSCVATYWRDLRSFTPIRELRRTAYSRDLEWRTWQRSLELSMLRCEAPLEHATQAVRAAWQEVGERLDHYLPSAPKEAEPDRADDAEQPQMSTRRSS
jgi:hypothetical protein